MSIYKGISKKYHKMVKPFFFKKNMSKEEMAEILNDDYPIVITEFEDIINRIYVQYPVVSKPDIALVVKTVFTCMREFLVLGKVINFSKFIFNMKLNFGKFTYQGESIPSLKVKLGTPTRFKSIEYGKE